MKDWKKLLLVIALALAVFVGAGHWVESRHGAGSREASAPLQGSSREIAIVANAVAGTVSLVDIAQRRVLREMDVTPDGQRVGFLRDPLQWLAQPIAQSEGGLNFAQDTDVSRDGTVLYVSRGFIADVAAFELASGELLWRTPIAGVRADHMTLSPDGKRLYVSAVILGGNVVEVLDTATGRRLGKLQAGQWPHDLHTSEGGGLLYTASLGNMLEKIPERDTDDDAYLVTLHHTQSFERLDAHSFEAGIRPFHVNRDGSLLYAQ